MHSADRPATRLATRLAFLVAGFGIACWAPLVPFAKTRLGVDDGVLGLLLLSLGIGSVVAMLLTGVMSARYGSKPIIIAGGLGLALVPAPAGDRELACNAGAGPVRFRRRARLHRRRHEHPCGRGGARRAAAR